MTIRVGEDLELISPWGNIDVGGILTVQEITKGGLAYLSFGDQLLSKGWTAKDLRKYFGIGSDIDALADPVNHPAHYTAHPSKVECIQITEHMGFCLGNAVKYIWRADLKGNAVEDLKKAAFYIQREIDRREKKAD